MWKIILVIGCLLFVTVLYLEINIILPYVLCRYESLFILIAFLIRVIRSGRGIETPYVF